MDWWVAIKLPGENNLAYLDSDAAALLKEYSRFRYENMAPSFMSSISAFQYSVGTKDGTSDLVSLPCDKDRKPKKHMLFYREAGSRCTRLRAPCTQSAPAPVAASYGTW